MKIHLPITKTVWILSLVSFFTDLASEMLYPILPIYLESIGFSVFYIGVLEGIAEATASFSKGYFGKLSDSLGRRVIFVRFGYTLSAISKPLMGIFMQPILVFCFRTLDRLGKGIRTGARDAILSNEAKPETKATVFGFHRSMDTLGAVVGPLFAILFLIYFPNEYQKLFLFAFLPGLLAVLFAFLLSEKNRMPNSKLEHDLKIFSFFSYWKNSPKEYKLAILGFLIFALNNSSDVFLLLKMKHTLVNDYYVIGVYIFYNLIYAIFGLPLGILADKLGIKKMYIFGLVLFAIVYIGMALNVNLFIYFGLFFLYGIYAAATEGISKAWISNLVGQEEVATAIGFYTTFQGFCTMFASFWAGWVWTSFDSQVMFLITGILSLLLVAYFSIFLKVRVKSESKS